MIDRLDHQPSTPPEGPPFLDGARQLGQNLRSHPFALGFLIVAVAAFLFRIGMFVGEVTYLVFDGDDVMAVAFGAAVLVALVAIGAWLDRRRRPRNSPAGQLHDDQR